MVTEDKVTVTDELKDFYQGHGYVVVRGLFSPDEAAYYRAHYMTLRRRGSYPGDLAGADATSTDPLKRYPRMIHMHRWDDVTLRWLLDDRLNRWLTGLLGREPYAVQTMLYFKPPGARGQALHQDNFYLRARPGTCIAAWMALDQCDLYLCTFCLDTTCCGQLTHSTTTCSSQRRFYLTIIEKCKDSAGRAWRTSPPIPGRTGPRRALPADDAAA